MPWPALNPAGWRGCSSLTESSLKMAASSRPPPSPVASASSYWSLRADLSSSPSTGFLGGRTRLPLSVDLAGQSAELPLERGRLRRVEVEWAAPVRFQRWGIYADE